jgi:hypothetical protein
MHDVGTITTPLGNTLDVLRDERGRYWTRLSYEGLDSLVPVQGFDREAAVLHLLPSARETPKRAAERTCTVCGALLSRFNEGTAALCTRRRGMSETTRHQLPAGRHEAAPRPAPGPEHFASRWGASRIGQHRAGPHGRGQAATPGLQQLSPPVRVH